jgi:hypothetical protein
VRLAYHGLLEMGASEPVILKEFKHDGAGRHTMEQYRQQIESSTIADFLVSIWPACTALRSFGGRAVTAFPAPTPGPAVRGRQAAGGSNPRVHPLVCRFRGREVRCVTVASGYVSSRELTLVVVRRGAAVQPGEAPPLRV